MTRIQPHGARSDAMNPVALALSQGAGFVARSYAGDKEQLSGLIQEALKYRGFALIDILQVCVSFNRINTYDWYKQRVYDAGKKGHDAKDLHSAMKLALAGGDKIPTGLIYRRKTVPFSERLARPEAGSLLREKYNPGKVRALVDSA